MTLRSESGTPNAGFSLMEVLVVLAILAMVAGIALSGLRRTTSALDPERRISQILAEAATLRNLAIRTGRNQSISPGADACPDSTGSVRFFPDGTASGPPLCFGTARPFLRVDALSGRLVSEERK